MSGSRRRSRRPSLLRELTERWPRGGVQPTVRGYLEDRLPKYVYYDQYDRLRQLSSRSTVKSQMRAVFGSLKIRRSSWRLHIMTSLNVEINGDMENDELTSLHAAAFRSGLRRISWNERLARYSLFWVCARHNSQLIGFINIIGDGGAHAVLLDTCVHPEWQGQGIGVMLVRRAADEARARGCEWLHADYEPGLASFYEDRCGMRSTPAGLLRLT